MPTAKRENSTKKMSGFPESSEHTGIVKTGRLTSSRGEKISAVEGLVHTARMRALLDAAKDETGEERRRLIRAQFIKKTGD